MGWLLDRLRPPAWHPGLLALGLATVGLFTVRPFRQPVATGSVVSWLGAYRRLVEEILAGRRLVTHQQAISRAVDYLDERLSEPGLLSASQRAELRSVQDDLTFLLELIEQLQRAS